MGSTCRHDLEFPKIVYVNAYGHSKIIKSIDANRAFSQSCDCDNSDFLNLVDCLSQFRFFNAPQL